MAQSAAPHRGIAIATGIFVVFGNGQQHAPAPITALIFGYCCLRAARERESLRASGPGRIGASAPGAR